MSHDNKKVTANKNTVTNVFKALVPFIAIAAPQGNASNRHFSSIRKANKAVVVAKNKNLSTFDISSSKKPTQTIISSDNNPATIKRSVFSAFSNKHSAKKNSNISINDKYSDELLKIISDSTLLTKSINKATLSGDIGQKFFLSCSMPSYATQAICEGNGGTWTNPNNAPVNTLPSAPTVNEDDTNVAVADNINISDSNGDSQTITLTFTGGTGSITTGLSFGAGDGTDDTSMSFSGSIASINTALDTLTFTPTANLAGTSAGAIRMQLNDGKGGADDDTLQFDIVAVNDDPTQTGTFPTDITVAGNVSSNLDFSGLSLADIDSASNNLVMTFTASAGILAASDSGGVIISGSGTSTLTLTGSITNIDTYINTTSNIQYTSAADANGNNAATVTVKINDGGNVGTGGGADIALGSVNVDIPAPQITSATYSEDTKSLVVTGINFITKSGVSNDVDVTKLTLTGEGNSSFTLTNQSANVEITSATSFTVIVGGTDVSSVEALLNSNGTTADDSTTYNLNAADDFISAYTDADTADITNAITVNGWPQPSITSTTYDTNTGILVVTGIDFSANGAANDVTAAHFTFTGEGGVTYTLTNTADVERDSATQFTFTLSATDKAAVNAIVNKEGSTSTGGTTYNIAASDNFISAVTLGNTADNSNAITVSNVAIPTIVSTTYDGSAGIFVVTGTNIPNISGATNDIDASKFTFTGEDANTYTLVGTSDVERTSPTSFSLTLDATDKAQVQKLINKAGASTTGGVTYNLAGAEDWALGADAAVNVVDSSNNGVIVSNVPVPAVTSATYNEDTKALVITGVNFAALGGANNDIDVRKFTFTGQAGSTFTLTGQSANVDITSVTSFTVTIGGTDVANVEALLNVNGSKANDNTTYNLSVADDFNAANTDGNTADTINALMVSGWPQPSVSSTTYDANTGVLVVTGIDFSANGSGFDVDASTITFTGEDGVTYTLTDTSDVNIDSSSQFTITLSATDKAAINALLNNNGTSLTGGANYNISFADNFMSGVTIGDTSDASGNGIIVSNVAAPIISSTAYNATTGVLVITGANISNVTGSANDIDASKFTFTGEGATTYTLVGTPDVERTSDISFSLTLDATDKAAVQKLINKNGTSSTSGTTYNIAAAEDWAKGAGASVNVVDATNAMNVSNIVSPSITSATYNSNTGALSVTGINLLQKSGAINDIDLSTLTLTGEAGGTYTLTTATDVDLTNATSFSATLSGSDKTQVDLLLHINGAQSDDSTSYNLAAADDWNTGADPAVNIVDTTNTVTVNGWPVPNITSSTYDEKSGVLVVTGENFSVNGGGFDIDASKLTFTGQANATYTLTDTSDVNITNATSFSLTLSTADITNIKAILNKNGTSSVDAINYNLSVADNFLTAITQGNTSDSTASITVNKVAPKVTTPNSALQINAANQIISGTYSTNGISIGLYLDANNDGISDGGAALATDNVAGGNWSMSASLVDDTVFNYVVIADFSNANESAHINVPTITEDSTAPTGYSATIQSNITASNASALAFTFAGAEVGTTYNYTITSSAGGGTITGTGTISTATDKISNIDVSSLNDGTLTLSVTLTDLASNAGNAVSDTTIKNIIPPNVAPVITQGSSVTVNMSEDNSPTAFSLSLSASDGNGDALTWSVSNAASNGVANVSGSGTSSNVSYVPKSDFSGTDSFVIQVNDANGGTDSIIVNVTVIAVNDLPTGAVLILGEAKEKSTLTASNTLVDKEGLGTISYTWKRGNISVSTANSYILTSDDIGSLMTVIASYTDGKGSVETVTSSSFGPIVNVNDAPVINGSAITKVNQDSAYSFTPTASDVDKDKLTFSIANKPSWASFDASTGSLTGTPDNTHIGATTNIVISVSDGIETISLSAFNIEVVNVNDAPVISGSAITKVNQDTAYSFTPTASDVDKDKLTFSIANKPSWASFDTSTGSLTGTPDITHVGTTSNIVISVSDGIETTSLSAFNIEVIKINQAPVITGVPITKVNQDVSYRFTPAASDLDKDKLTFSIANKPSWANFNTLTGALTGTPNENHIGLTNNIVIAVSDSIETTSLSAFSIEVVNINDAPVISGSPITKVNQDASYRFIPTASDVDGDNLTFSISNKPSWASFNVATGELTGTPNSDNLGSTNNIVITVSDGEKSTSLAAFSIEVINKNEAPITQTGVIELNEDESKSVNFIASDINQDELTFIIVTQPSFGAVSQLNNIWTYTPEANFTGDDNFTFKVNDGELDSNISTVSIHVLPINDKPLAQDDVYTLAVNNEGRYELDVMSNDADIDGDELSIIGASASVGTVLVENNKLIYQAIEGNISDINFEYIIQDVSQETSTANVSLTIEQNDDAALPNIIVPQDIEINAQGLFTKVDLGVATATNKNGDPIAVSLIDNNTVFEPGEHIVYWQASDSENNTSVKSQKVTVKPIISIEKDAQTAEGTNQRVSVYLNGQSPQYPVTISYSISGTSDLNDHDLIGGEITIEQGLEGVIAFNVFEDGLSEGNETLVINLNTNQNLGNNAAHILTIVEENVAPVIEVQVSQMNEVRSLVINNEEVVNIKASVTDANPNDNHTITWTSGHEGIVNTSSIDSEFIFNAQGLAPAVYQITVTAMDDANIPLETRETVYIEVIQQLAQLGSEDTDGDLIPDNQEGYSDSDNDGIPDYLDAISECNVMQEQLHSSDQYLVEGEPGVCLRKGSTVASNETGGVQLLESELPSDETSKNIGGLFDFIATGLPQQGQNYTIVFPQVLPIPQGAIYRKFKNGVWVNFVEDENNIISSAAGEAGYCPPPGQSGWTTGLTEGHWCVQLVIEDGGANDDDGIKNGTIVDPGGVAVILDNNNLPTANPDSITMSWNENIIIDVLVNDTDTDNDELKISSATADFGTVTVENNKLVYQSLNDFFGLATIQYSISDNNGGTAHSTVEVNVVSNMAPVANDDVASTKDTMPINIAVLENDTDIDGDFLTITEALAEFGNVVINTDQTLTYTPKLGFAGLDTISYKMTDGKNETVSAKVTVTVELNEPTSVKRKNSSGTMSNLLILISLLMLRRKKVRMK
ncbi:Ig-like domain-containing protein [Pseudoalteromonas denitrificans]|uniref:Putative Ig domain-containing protein n=1 Tax=Pseudoalteromonas denitrificans DSM 6059 TaxID=1123010 RepID=A0A1I1Q1F9_9GAMM|nr:tandem-95 repeat protein [Pseudoalteromonas denitrificans]SFD15889.1 Putative Ig domain-containing protein [Pseudoalteromonas denitrificans DSM 6059]